MSKNQSIINSMCKYKSQSLKLKNQYINMMKSENDNFASHPYATN